MTRSDDLVTRLVDEIDRLRTQLELWRNAAEAYERGSIGLGDQLVDEARKENKP